MKALAINVGTVLATLGMEPMPTALGPILPEPPIDSSTEPEEHTASRDDPAMHSAAAGDTAF